MDLEGILSTLEILATKRVEHRAVQRFPEFFGWEEFFDANGCIGFRVNLDNNKQPHLLWITFDEETEGFSEYARFIFAEDASGDMEEMGDEENRDGFDKAFESINQRVIEILHEPEEYGEYLYDDEPDFPYGYVVWKRDEVIFTLAQAYYDPQCGRDITLWALPSKWNLRPPLEL